MFNTLLLDLDGTLVDSAPDLAIAVDQMLATLGRPPAGLDRVRRWVGDGTPKLIDRALSNQDEPDTPTDPDLFARAKAAFYSAYHTCNGAQSRLYPGVLEFLQAAQERGCQLGIVTNKPETFTLPLLEKLDVAHFFGAVISGDSLTDANGNALRKPDPAPLQAAIDILGGSPSSSLMIGDSRADIAAARALGVPCIGVRYGYNHGVPIERCEPDWVVDSLEDFIPSLY